MVAVGRLETMILFITGSILLLVVTHERLAGSVDSLPDLGSQTHANLVARSQQGVHEGLVVPAPVPATGDPPGDRAYVAGLEARLQRLEAQLLRSGAAGGAAAPGAVTAVAAAASTAALEGGGRQVFIDLGANCGNSYLKLRGKKKLPGTWEVYLWEANPQLIEFYLTDLATKDKQVTVVPLAAWTENKKMSFFLTKGQDVNITDKSQMKAHKCNPNSNYQPAGASSLFSGMGTGSADDAKRKGRLFQAGKEIEVDAVDFNAWLVDKKLTVGDQVVLKIDIEGAEIPLLKHMLVSKAICMVDVFYVEWHSWMLSDPKAVAKTKAFEDGFLEAVSGHCGGPAPELGAWH